MMPFRGDGGAGESEGGGAGAFGEEALAAADGDGEGLEPELVDQVVLEEGLDEVAAAVDLKHRAVAGFEAFDLPGDIVAVDDDRLVPGGVERLMGDGVFGGFVEDLADRIGGVLVGPITGEDVVGGFAEQQVEGHAHLLGHDFACGIVEVREGPAAELKAAGAVFIGAAGRLHDAV